MSYQKHNFEPGAVLFASQLNAMDNQIEFLSNQGSSFSDNFKTALLNCFENVAWINENGQTYYDALYDSLYPDNMWFITNILTGCVTSNNATSILKNNSYVATIIANQGYMLDGATVSITMGGNDVTNLYYSSGSINIPNVTGDLVITVTALSSVVSVSAVFTQGQDIPITIDSTRIGAYIAADGKWTLSDDSYSVCIPVTSGKRYALAWSTTDSSSVGTIFRYGFSNTNTASGQVLKGWVRSTPQSYIAHEITAFDSYLVIQLSGSVASSAISNGYLTLTEINSVIHDSDSLDTLKQYLVVTATYADSSTAVVSDYTLSGTLTAGTSTITVSYGGKTDTFNVTVIGYVGSLGYVDDGLLMLLDGIANGENGVHNTTVSNLYDQSGNGQNWSINAGTVTATDTALVFSNSCFAPSFSGGLAEPNTIEIVCEPNNIASTDYQCIICAISAYGGDTKYGTISTYSGKLLHKEGGTAYGCISLSSGVHTYSFVRENGVWKGFKDGQAVSFGTTHTTWRTGVRRFGSFRNASDTSNQYFFSGKVYSYRYYYTALTNEEIAHNRENDVNRFSS